MVSMTLNPHLVQKITLNANRASAFKVDPLSTKVHKLALQIFENAKDFLRCFGKTTKETLWFSPLYMRIGHSFKLAPLNYRIAVSVILITITNIFLAAIKFAKLPKKVDAINEKQIFDFLKTVVATDEIEEIKRAFQEKLDSLQYEVPREDFHEQIYYVSRNLKRALAQITRNQCLRVLGKGSESAFNRFWIEEFEVFCTQKTQEAILTFNIITDYEYSLLRFLDKAIIKEKVIAPLPEEEKDKIVSPHITYDTIYAWHDLINWEDNKSLYYMGPLFDPDGGRVYPKQVRTRVEQALGNVINKTATAGAPPKGTKEFEVFYEKLEYKIKSYIQRLLEDEAKLNEKIADQKYEDLDQQTQRELRFLCENKARFCCQIAVAGSHCPVRLNNEVSQLWTELFAAVSLDDELLPLEEYLKKILGYARLKIAKEEIAALNTDVHTYGAYMQSIGQAFNIPGSKDEIEHMRQTAQHEQNLLAAQFSVKYTPEYLIEEIQNYYKEEKRQPFREKIQQFLQENMGDFNQDEYTDLFENIQRSVNEKHEQLKDLKIDAHGATALFIQIINAVDPSQKVTLDEESGKESSIAEISVMLNNNEMTFQEFQRLLLSLEHVKDLIKQSKFYTDSQQNHFILFTRNWSHQLKDLNCEQALAKLAQGLCNKNDKLVNEGQDELSLALTNAEKTKQIRAIINEQGLTGVDCNLVEDEEAFARSLRNAILVKQKSDYLAYCFEGNTETSDLPANISEQILVSLNFLQQ